MRDGQTSPEEVAALGALYQGDRGDAAASLSSVLALLGASIAYITGTLAFSTEIYDRFGWLGIFLPAPVWFFAAFHSLMVITSMIRGLSLKAVEEKLLGLTGFTQEQASMIGMRSYERVMNISDPRASWPHRMANVLTYLGIGTAIAGYTLYFVVNAPASLLARSLALCGYSIMCGFVVASWLSGFKLEERTRSVLFPTPTGDGPPDANE